MSRLVTAMVAVLVVMARAMHPLETAVSGLLLMLLRRGRRSERSERQPAERDHGALV